MSLRSFLVLVCFCAIALPAFAADSPTPAPTATPSACDTLQDCVDAAVPVVVTTCTASNPLCEVTNADKFALTAGQVAERAIVWKRCRDKKRRGGCNACYNIAKSKLQNRYQVILFHNLLAHAVSIITAEQRSFCPTLNK
jgi:hypothetical protein